MQVNSNNLFITGYITKFKDGTQWLERKYISNFPKPGDKTHTIIDTDTLLSIAKTHYNDCKYWFIIADVNYIENPFELTTGDVLNIPNLQRVKSMLT